MQHIDRKSLYTSLEARIRYLHSFLDFGPSEFPPDRQDTLPQVPVTLTPCFSFLFQDDIEALVGGSKYIQALIPAVVNIVYKKLLQYDITARAFTTRSTAFEGPMDEMPDEESPQILHRKMFLRAYLKKLCSDPTQMEFWEYLDKVGMMHTGLGRTHPLHIEYIHIGAGLAVIQDVLNEAILSHPRLPLPRKMGILKALNKVIWIQNDLFTKWYVQDGEEFTAEMDYGVIEKEGWLHGKKVLRPDDDSDGSDITVSPTDEEAAKGKAKAGVCPFTGVSASMAKVKVSDEKDGATESSTETATESK